MTLSILIPTLPGREDFLATLTAILKPQLTDQVEVLTDDAPKNVPTGVKRNDLLNRAQGEWVVFIDDDDQVPDYYVSEILKALEQNPDCVTFKGWMTTDGRNKKNFVLRLGSCYCTHNGVYLRWPNHITPIRRSIAMKVVFPSKWQREDYEWSAMINGWSTFNENMKTGPGLLTSEVYIDKDMYFYLERTNKIK